MKNARARAERNDQPPSTSGTSPRRARVWLLASIVALGLIGTAAQVASADPATDPVQTTAIARSASAAVAAVPASPIRLATAGAAFRKVGDATRKSADVRKWELAVKFDILRRHHIAEQYRRLIAHEKAEKARAAARKAKAAAPTGRCGGDLPPCWVMNRESGGNIRARNPRSSASGKWQFIRSTWAGFGGYSDAYLAPESVQDAKARQLWAGGRGCGHWSAC